MRVLSLNAWCGAVMEPLVEWLPTVGADVLCLQEVTWTPGYVGWVTYADADRTSRQRASLFDDLRRALPRHQAHFYTCDTGPVECDDGVIRRQHFGIATLVDPRLAVTDVETAFVHGEYANHEYWPAEDRGRLAHAFRVVDDEETAATIAHFHGVRMASGKGDSPERRKQAERVAELVTHVRRPHDVVVVAGDMNVLPDSETFDVFAGIGLTDLVGSSDTRSSIYTKPVRHASYLLVSDEQAVASFDIASEPEVSDHRALIVDLHDATRRSI